MTLTPVLALPASSKHGVPRAFDNCPVCNLWVLFVTTPSGREKPVDPQSDDAHGTNCPRGYGWRGR